MAKSYRDLSLLGITSERPNWASQIWTLIRPILADNKLTAISGMALEMMFWEHLTEDKGIAQIVYKERESEHLLLNLED